MSVAKSTNLCSRYEKEKRNLYNIVMNSRITEIFKTELPIIAGGMAWCSG